MDLEADAPREQGGEEEQDRVEHFLRKVAACAASYEARAWEEIVSCHEEISLFFASLSVDQQYAIAKEATNDELDQLITTIVSRPWPNTTFLAPMDHVEQYPEGLLRYMLEAAEGRHGVERMRMSVTFFRACSDCPEVAYEPACEVLRSRSSQQRMEHALLQLRFAPSSIGEVELWEIVLAPEKPSMRAAALTNLSKRGSPRAGEAVYELLSSSNLEDVGVGVGALGELAKNSSLMTQEVEDKLVVALDGAYGSLPEFHRYRAIVALLRLQDGAQHLRTIATGEPDPEVAAMIRSAAKALETGVSAEGVRRQLQERLAGTD